VNFAPRINYKGIAREKLLGRYSTVIGAVFIMRLFLFMISYITDKVVEGSTIMGNVIYMAIVFITGLIGAVFTVGELTIYMKLSCNDAVSAWNVFDGFKGHPDKAIILQFKVAIRCLAFWLFACITFGVMYAMGIIIQTDAGAVAWNRNAGGSNGIIPLIVCIAAVLTGIIGTVYVRMLYSQVFFLLIDHPEYETGQIMAESKRMMEGQMLDYLFINLSFIPILILGLLSFGTGMFFIQPYRGMTLTQFYLSLASGAADKGRNIDVMIAD